ncbi:hypothetical protein [Microvirga roseola]|uniref:hypothetical protein n=1 Tax=Microvirga roseola TaxID=2883126 RepID=UPI001E3B253F|nr:hypothetical protein [Microvirga roseola]
MTPAMTLKSRIFTGYFAFVKRLLGIPFRQAKVMALYPHELSDHLLRDLGYLDADRLGVRD